MAKKWAHRQISAALSGAVWGGGQEAAPTPRFTRGPDERNKKKHSYNSTVCFLYKPGHVFPAGECCVVLYCH